MAVPLTSLSHGAGCGCKLPASAIAPLLARLPDGPHDPDVLVGFDTSDDAGVYRVSDELAIVTTVDFFTPIVDDPFDFGRIAATNALSDVYAMGATPVTALNLVAFSLETLGEDVLLEILRGAADVAAGAGVAILGGHSIEDAEPKFGWAVTGFVAPDQVITNAGARAGDALVLTKPLGAGAVSTAVKRGIEGAPLGAAVAVMTTLNRDAAAAARTAGAHAMTDVTGFGLLGHLHELASASGSPPSSRRPPCPRSRACSSCSRTPTSRRSPAARGATGARRGVHQLRRGRARGAALARVRRDDLWRPTGRDSRPETARRASPAP